MPLWLNVRVCVDVCAKTLKSEATEVLSKFLQTVLSPHCYSVRKFSVRYRNLTFYWKQK